jgi:hypothetical protein
MRREADFFGDHELVLVYVARRLKDALSVEKILDDDCLDYAVEPMPYQSGLLFRSTKVGAFFYVMSHEEARAGTLLQRHGKKLPLTGRLPGNQA